MAIVQEIPEEDSAASVDTLSPISISPARLPADVANRHLRPVDVEINPTPLLSP